MSIITKGSYIRRIGFDFLLSLVSVGIALAICSLYGEGLVKYTEDANKLSYLSRYYSIKGVHNSAAFVRNNMMVISCHEKTDEDSLVRKRIGDVIAKASMFSPKVIGLDIRFKGKHDKAGDSYLERIVSDNKDKVVFSRFFDGDADKGSYFDSTVPELKYGYGNVGDFYNNASSKEPSFAEAVLLKAGMMDRAFKDTHGILDFASLGQIQYNTAETFLEMTDEQSRRKVEGKIVLIGDVEDEKDLVYLPFRINGQDWLPGIFYHVYCINSMREGGPHFKEGRGINIILSLGLTFIYLLVSGLFSTYIKKQRTNKKTKLYWILMVVKPVVMSVFWMAIPLFLIGVITSYFRIAPNLVLAMLSVSIILFFDNFINELKDSSV